MFIAKGEQEKGFTLIEAMITMGVVTVIGLGMMSLMQNTMKGQQNATTYSDFSTLDSAIQVLFNGNSSACGSALQSSPGVPVSFPSPVPSTLSSPIPIPIVAPNNVTLLNSATPVNGWTYSLAITKILESLAPTTYMVNMQLTGQKTTSAQTLGSPVRTGSPHTVFVSTGSCPSGQGQCITGCGTSNLSQSQSQGTFNSVVGFRAPAPSGMPTNGPAPTPTPWMTTWTSPPSATAALVETWGAGGGAGFFSCFKTSIQIFDDANSGTRSRAHSTCTSGASTGQGGGGGAYSAAYVMLQPSTKYYVYVGVGGLGDNINKTPGWPGGDSYFALSKTSSPTNSPPLVWAGGGQGGGNGNSTAIAPNGGVPGTGQIQILGEPGSYDIGTGYYNGMSANGGSSPYGGSGGEGSTRDNAGCSAGNLPGGGGGATGVWGQGPSTNNKYTPMCNGAGGYVRITYSVPPNYTCPTAGQSLGVNSSGQMVCNQITYVTASYEANPSCSSGAIVTYCAASNGLTCNPASGSNPTSCVWVTATNNGPEPSPDPSSTDGSPSGTCTATCVVSTPAIETFPGPQNSPE